uniref:G-protein coupled receptors family 1 profile domain-containing protein n=1 Tax=Timema shepardi TaxID=629360 RepID=A0A7R9B6J9_TIMSH|nr:unnamed protein product [Timema shepardi]
MHVIKSFSASALPTIHLHQKPKSLGQRRALANDAPAPETESKGYLKRLGRGVIMDSHSVLDALSKERNISLEEMYISYPRSATILAAACAVIFSVVGVTVFTGPYATPIFLIRRSNGHTPRTTLNSSVTTVRAFSITCSMCAVKFLFSSGVTPSVLVVIVEGNLVTALALLRCRKLRKHATTAFVISLSVSDLLFSAINLPLTASRYVSEAWVLGPTLCKLFPFFFYGNVAVSLLSMVAITINRYVLISCHLLYDNVYTSCHIGLMILFAWSFSFSMMLPPLVELWGQLGLHPPTFSCTILNKDGSSPKKFLFLLGFVIPCIVIIVSYSCIYWKVLKSRKKLRSHREDFRLTWMMLIIFCCFLLCFLPLMLVNVIDDEVNLPTLHVLASVLAWASSVINPFIYAGSNKQYRTAYKKLFCNYKDHPELFIEKQVDRATELYGLIRIAWTSLFNMPRKKEYVPVAWVVTRVGRLEGRSSGCMGCMGR